MPQQFVQVAEYAPDAPALAQKTTSTAKNVVPGFMQEYLPVPSPVKFGNNLPALCAGVFGATSTSKLTYFYAATGARIYQQSGTTWTDRSKLGGYSLATGERWGFTQYRNQVVAVAMGAPVQVSDVNGSAFADLITSTLKPQARQAAIINRDWLVLGDTTDAVDGDRPGRVWWSARGDITDFDPDTVTQCGFEDLDAQDGEVQRIIGYEYGVPVCRKALWRMSYVGGDVQYRFDKIVPDRGAISPGSVAAVNRNVFFIDGDGFYAFDGANVSEIGAGKVDRTIASIITRSDAAMITSAVWPLRNVVVWSIPNGGSASRLLFYQWKTGRWSYAEVPNTFCFSTYTEPTSLDGEELGDVILDDPPYSGWNLDAPELEGGAPAFGIFSQSNETKFMSGGEPMPPTVHTEEISFGLRRASVNEAMPVSEGTGPLYMSGGVRDSLSAKTIKWSAERGLNLTGKCNVRAQGRYMRFQIRRTGAWDSIVGTQFDPTSAGDR